MKTILRLFLSLICLYVFIGKGYTTLFYLKFSPEEVVERHIPNIVVLLSCILVPFLLWGKIAKIKLGTLWIAILVYTFFSQVVLSALELNVHEDSDAIQMTFLVFLPNFLALFILITLIVIILKRSKIFKRKILNP